MYFVSVILLLFVFPLASVGVEAFRTHQAVNSMVLIGRWWVFWAVGVRLFIAGVRQVVQPRFTAEEIFGIHDPGSLSIVREVGFANLSMGILGICSLFRLDWILAAGIVGGLYYGFAGLGHIPKKNKNAKEYTAMVSDGVVCVVLLVSVIISLF